METPTKSGGLTENVKQNVHNAMLTLTPYICLGIPNLKTALLEYISYNNHNSSLTIYFVT